MNVMAKVADIARSPGDPTVLESGPSSLRAMDNLAKGLGWFSIGLGMTELLAAERLARLLGMEGKETLIRAYGLREIAAGMLCLAPEKTIGVWSRVAGDGLDIATLLSAHTDDNPKKRNVGVALAAVAGVTLLDLVCAQALTVRHGRGWSKPREYGDRSGWPNGFAASHGAARDFQVPDDMKAQPSSADQSSVTGRTSAATQHFQDSLGIH